MNVKNVLLIGLLLVGFNSEAQTDPFEGRTTTPSADVALDKENIPVKKETFEDKLKRFKTEGFKVAIVFYSGEIGTKVGNPNSTTQVVTQISLKEKMPSEKSNLMPLAESFSVKMNEAFDTDIFEVVDMKNIPYKEVKVGKTDYWESTKYRLVLSYSATPIFDYSSNSMGEFSAKMEVKLNVVGTEYVNTKKGVKMKFPIRAGNLGYYASGVWKSKTDQKIKSVSELAELVKAPMGADLLARLQAEQDEKIGKFIEKRKK